MDSANKVISFVLGLVVVIVFLAVITGRFKLKSIASLPFVSKTTPTPTVTSKGKIISSVTVPGTTTQNTGVSSNPNSNYKPYNTISNNGNLKSIPSTGEPTILLSIALSSLLGGIYLKKKK